MNEQAILSNAEWSTESEAIVVCMMRSRCHEKGKKAQKMP